VKKIALWILTAFLLKGCASVQSPQGGPKDTELPILLKSTPRNGEVNFKEKAIVLEYSEMISENEGRQPFLSPLTQVTVIPAGRKIRIVPDSGWKQNQTYELRLGKKIKDEREGNIAADTSLIFSTGNEPDRIRIILEIQDLSGNLLDGKSTSLLSAPNNVKYFSTGERVLSTGGLKEGKYLLEVFRDKNENLKYEEEDGRLFTDSIQIDSSFTLKARLLPQMAKTIRYYHQRKKDTLQIESSRPLVPDSQLLKECIARNEEGTLFRIKSPNDKIIFQNYDSLGTAFPDTLEKTQIDSTRSLTPIDLKKKISIHRLGNRLEIKSIWNWKVLHHPGEMEYTRDSLWEKIKQENLNNGYRILIPQGKSGKIRLRMDSLTFYNNKKIIIDSVIITPTNLEEDGTISGSIESKGKNLIAELINEKKEVCARGKSGVFNWKVPPGKYSLQIFSDKNGDGKYTGGNRSKNRKAEPLYIYPKIIELKPGWDLENIQLSPEL
jgi:hypothetical protein